MRNVSFEEKILKKKKRNIIRYSNILLNSIDYPVITVDEYDRVGLFENESLGIYNITYNNISISINKKGDFDSGIINLIYKETNKDYNRRVVSEFTYSETGISVYGLDILDRSGSCKYIYPFSKYLSSEDRTLVSYAGIQYDKGKK